KVGGAARISEASRTVTALKLLELQRNCLLMYTSCGWFFDELSGIETVQVLQYAGRAVQLAEELFGRPFEPAFLDRLAEAKRDVRLCRGPLRRRASARGSPPARRPGRRRPAPRPGGGGVPPLRRAGVRPPGGPGLRRRGVLAPVAVPRRAAGHPRPRHRRQHAG